MDDSQQDTITKLKFLSRVGKGEKINVKDMTLHADSYVTSISRTVWNIDNRNNTMTFIQNTIGSAFNLILLLMQNQTKGSTQLIKEIIKDIIKAKSGIFNLKTTYNDDTFFCCGVDTYIQSIEARLLEIKTSHSDLYPNETECSPGITPQKAYADQLNKLSLSDSLKNSENSTIDKKSKGNKSN